MQPYLSMILSRAVIRGNLRVMYFAWKENSPEMQKYEHRASPLEANALPERSETCKQHD